MHPLIEKYGKDFISELLDIIHINNGRLEDAMWRLLLIKHGKIRQTTTIIRSNVYRNTWNNSWSVLLKNGRGNYVVSIEIHDHDLPQIRKELSE